MNMDGSAFTAAVEMWQIVFKPHDNCPHQCMGAQGVKCVLLNADRERFTTMMAPLKVMNGARFLYFIEDNYMFKRMSIRPAILEMRGGEFMVGREPGRFLPPFFSLESLHDGPDVLGYDGRPIRTYCARLGAEAWR